MYFCTNFKFYFSEFKFNFVLINKINNYETT
jgi:hypothetical protein